ncbi:hypothetical protein PybrP1_011632 [[Pythium] brassicae (nom. inval.)]|nr:hypothetical protein PybrP1_011632 [[Pythium] brassicae (nom. inval.)]
MQSVSLWDPSRELYEEFAKADTSSGGAMDEGGSDDAEHWSVDTISLSYLIAVTGSYCTIQLMEQWRTQETRKRKLVLLMLSSVALGGCGIWCMHFTGMTALGMVLEDGSKLEVDFEFGLTVLSFIAAVGGVFVGLKVASEDPFFLELEQSRRKQILANDLQKMTLESMLRRGEVARKLKFIALFSRLWRIAFGGFLAALGVLGMHYLGMLAQRTNAVMHFDAGIIVLSSVVAFVTANAAFWILFRALTFWPQYESLRIGSALIMGIAVCGTHYIGMGAAVYKYSDENYADITRILLDGRKAGTIASHGSLLACYWLSTTAVVISLRNQILISSRSNKSTSPRAGNQTGASGNQQGTSIRSQAPNDPSFVATTGPTATASGPRALNIKLSGTPKVAPGPTSLAIVPQ